jgi:beta-lactamase class A
MGNLSIRRAEQEIARIASLTVATAGVCAIHVESGHQLSLNASMQFPMASTYKIPIAITVLRSVDEGRLALDQRIEITERDISPGSGYITEYLHEPGLSLSIRNLLEIMLRISDNTASDLVLRLAGGAQGVMDFVYRCGLSEMRIDRTTKHLLADFNGLTGIALDEWTISKFRTALEAATDAQKQAAQQSFLSDARDSCSPALMASLLATVQRGDLLSTSSSELLLSIMRHCQTGRKRIMGLLPAGVTVAHKTGTIGDVIVNDAGILTLPADAGHVAIAVFVKSDRKALVEYERLIAEIARVAYDYFLFAAA